MFTTLVAQKAPAGTRKSKTTPRKREDLIENCGIAVGKLLRYSGFAREAFIWAKIILQPRPVPGHCNHSLREQDGPGTRGYRPPKSESRFTFRNNFLSCEVTEVSRNFPAASSQWTSLCNEKSSSTSASRTSISASWG